MTEYIQVWQCIGCGKIEAPQPCIGVCQDRKVLMVGKDEHQQVLDQLRDMHAHWLAARQVLSRLASSTPVGEQWERSYRAFQQQARDLIGSEPPDPEPDATADA